MSTHANTAASSGAATPEVGSLADIFGEVISSYTLADQLRDGSVVQIDPAVTGANDPMFCTRAAYLDLIEWPEDRGGLQDETGRALDVADLVRWQFSKPEVRAVLGQGGTVPFPIDRVPRTDPYGDPVTVTHRLGVTWPDDGGKGVALVMTDLDI